MKLIILFCLFIIAAQPSEGQTGSDSLSFSIIESTVRPRTALPEIIWSDIFRIVEYQAGDLYDQKESDSIFQKMKPLIGKKINKKNSDRFIELAMAAWGSGRFDTAALIWQALVRTFEHEKANKTYHNSDIPGDKNSNSYGYGSYISDELHRPCRLLADYYLLKKKYDSAAYYHRLAYGTYAETFNCGTGHHWYKQKELGQLSMILWGLGKEDSLINLLLPVHSDYPSDNLILALQSKYGKEKLRQAADSGLNNFRDSFSFSAPSESRSYHNGVWRTDSVIHYDYYNVNYSFMGYSFEKLYHFLSGTNVSRDMIKEKLKEEFLFRKTLQ